MPSGPKARRLLRCRPRRRPRGPANRKAGQPRPPGRGAGGGRPPARVVAGARDPPPFELLDGRGDVVAGTVDDDVAVAVDPAGRVPLELTGGPVVATPRF